MSDTVKLVIEISNPPKNDHERWVLAHGISLDNNSEQAEVQTYLAGYIKGCEQGREDLIDEVLDKVSEIPTYERDGCWVKNDVYRVLENIINRESEEEI